jgi:nucleoside-diphosphate-sugar epimerase
MQERFPDSLRLFEAELSEEGSLNDAMAGCDGCFHSASPHPNPFPDDQGVLQTEVVEPAIQGTLNALHAAKQAGPQFHRFVLTSSFAAVCELGNPLKERGYTYSEVDWNNYSNLGLAPLEGALLFCFLFCFTRLLGWITTTTTTTTTTTKSTKSTLCANMCIVVLPEL